jgi:hypothetical protein
MHEELASDESQTARNWMQAKSWLPESDVGIKGNINDIVDKPLGLPSRR